MDKDPFNQIIKKWQPKGAFVDLVEKYLGMNAGLWSSVCVWSWIFKNFLENFCMFVNEEVCEIIISSTTDYEFSAAICIFKALIWSVYYYHEMLSSDIDRREKYKRLVVYGFHSWQINWYLTPRREKLFMKTSIASRLRPICSWFSLDHTSNSWLNVILSPIMDLSYTTN